MNTEELREDILVQMDASVTFSCGFDVLILGFRVL